MADRRLAALLLWLTCALLPAQAGSEARPQQDRQQHPQQHPLGPGPAWGGDRPDGANDVFATADGCARCHSASPDATALRSALGEDVSPHGLWQGTVMANSFRDPYWRAQVALEGSLDPERRREIEGACMRCHAPMLHHTHRLGGLPKATVREVEQDPLAQDGVSCAVCHQIRARNLGDETTFAGKGRIGRGRVIYGPYERPVAGPMLGMTGYAPKHGAHIRSSALCATCHTLHTHYQGDRFPEQTPYLEWRNSEFHDEGPDGATATSRTCQQCHMPDLGAMRIAREPTGGDYLLELREPYRGHAFVGGNAFLLDLLRKNRRRLGVTASDASLERMAFATRRQLTTATVDLAIGEIVHADDELRFSVRVRNLTGHKFPTGYPARRAWLHVAVDDGTRVVFEVGAFREDGTIRGVIGALGQEHVTRIDTAYDVPIWELVAADADGEPTTALTRMSARHKDTRLLPRGWRPDGPHAADTAPVGTDGDPDFVAGGDRVQVVVPYPQDAPRANVRVWVHYQAIPPHWVEELRYVDADECRAFVEIYDAADKTPETVASASRSEPL